MQAALCRVMAQAHGNVWRWHGCGGFCQRWLSKELGSFILRNGSKQSIVLAA